jgi:hypothetical protein
VVGRHPPPVIPAEERVVIRIERVTLPEGLRATAHRDHNGDLVIYVSTALDAGKQRAAVMAAVRASRRAGWRAGLPVGVAAFGMARLWLRHGTRALRARPAAWVAVATAVGGVAAVAGIVLATPPHASGPAAAARPSAGSTTLPQQSGQPGGQPAQPGRHQGQVQPVSTVSPTTLPGQPGQPQPGGTSPVAGGPTNPTSPSPGPGPTTSAPAPAPSSSAPAGPSPSPTASPSPPPPPPPGKSGSCVVVLGLQVCLPPVSVSVSVSA